MPDTPVQSSDLHPACSGGDETVGAGLGCHVRSIRCFTVTTAIQERLVMVQLLGQLFICS
jgi:hypothetical protein